MSKQEKQYIEKIASDYQESKPSKLDQLKALDRKAKKGAQIFAYIFGSIGALVLGIGMCFAMKVIPNLSLPMPLGIIIGLLGIAMVSINYFIYKKIFY